ncbi:hypothetical protein V7S43_012391 [Phytophthora oleae]|uniref:Uncharacterized protein n=1 Tax=Phytophthora oleae TaxID=2107226 RepID=A0ABD3F848_9STRA
MEAPYSVSPLLAIPASQESALSAAESTQSLDLSLPTNDVVDLTIVSSAETPSSASLSSTSSEVDAFGIPLEVYHYRQQKSRHDVWEVAHRLTTLYTKATGLDAELYTHVCLLCAQQLTCSPFAASDAWEGALHRWCNPSNARAHMIALHEDLQAGKADKNMKLKAAAQHVGDAIARAHAHENKRAKPCYDQQSSQQTAW